MDNTVYDIIIIAGQSNAQGCGIGEDPFEYIPDDDILIERGDFSSLVKKTEYGNEYLDLKLSDNYYIEKATLKEGCGCFAFSFAKKYKEFDLEKGRKVLLIQTAIGGTGFSKKHWGVGDMLYERMCKMVRYALSLNSKNRLVSFLWHQGEHDTFENPQFNFEERKQFYYDNLNSMINSFRKEFGVVPFVCAGFTRQWLETYTSQSKAVYEAIKEVSKTNEKIAFIHNTHDLKSNAEKVSNGDEVHFCKEAQRILGLRYYDKWREINSI